MKKLVASGVAALSIATGSLAVAVLNPLGAASAQTGSTATTAPATGSTGATTAAPTRGGALKSVLDGLVADGTITQAQADAISAKLDAARAANPAPEKGMRGVGGANLDDIATALGITADDLRTQLEGGATLSSIAGDKVAALTTLLTDKANARIDQALTDGKITAETAATMKAGVPAMVTAMLDGTAPHGGPGGPGGPGGRGVHGPGGRGDHGPLADGAPAGSDAAGSTTTTTP
jgi:polyhydroxyalkanoate synthesis regulator phasin